MNILKPLLSAKKIAIFLLVAVLAITLMACEDQSSYVPYGSISDETYLAIDDYSVTKRELYDQMRTTSASRLSDLIEKIVFSDVELDLGDLSDFEVESFEREINNALFSNSNITAKQISEMLDNVLAQRILSFVDSFAITHPDTDKDLMIAYFEAVIEDV